jgi:hypothetical protein
VLAIATLVVLVVLSSFHATEADHHHDYKTMKQWAWLQLAVLCVLSVSYALMFQQLPCHWGWPQC